MLLSGGAFLSGCGGGGDSRSSAPTRSQLKPPPPAPAPALAPAPATAAFAYINGFGPNGIPEAKRVLSPEVAPAPAPALTRGSITAIAVPAAPNLSPWLASAADTSPYANVGGVQWVPDWRDPTNNAKRIAVVCSGPSIDADANYSTEKLWMYAQLFESTDGGQTATPVAVLNPVHRFAPEVAAGSPLNNIVLPSGEDGRRSTMPRSLIYLDQAQRMEVRPGVFIDVRYVLCCEFYQGANLGYIFVSDAPNDTARWFQVTVTWSPGGYVPPVGTIGNSVINNAYTQGSYHEFKGVYFNRYNGYFYLIGRTEFDGWAPNSKAGNYTGGLRQHYLYKAKQPGIEGLRSWNEKGRLITPRTNWMNHSYVISLADLGDGRWAMLSCDFADRDLGGTSTAPTLPAGDSSRYLKSQFSLWRFDDLDRDDPVLVHEYVLDTIAQPWSSGMVHQAFLDPDNQRITFVGQQERHDDGSFIWFKKRAAHVAINVVNLKGNNPYSTAHMGETRTVLRSRRFDTSQIEFLRLPCDLSAPNSTARVRLLDANALAEGRQEVVPGYDFDGCTVDPINGLFKVVWQGVPSLPAGRTVVPEIETRGGARLNGLYARYWGL